jgi:hypothetical protein
MDGWMDTVVGSSVWVRAPIRDIRVVHLTSIRWEPWQTRSVLEQVQQILDAHADATHKTHTQQSTWDEMVRLLRLLLSRGRGHGMAGADRKTGGMRLRQVSWLFAVVAVVCSWFDGLTSIRKTAQRHNGRGSGRERERRGWGRASSEPPLKCQ